MVPNPFSVSLTHKSPHFFRLFSYSARPSSNLCQRSQLSLNPVQISGFKACSYPIRCCNNRIEFKGLGCFYLGWPENAGRICASAGSGGSGGLGGSGGGDSGGGDETNGGSSGGIDWSFFSWFFTPAILTCIWDLIRQLVFDQASKVDLNRTAVSGSMGLPLVVGHTLRFWNLVDREIAACFDALLSGMACIYLFIVLLCIWILVVACDFATRKVPKWGLESYIENLPKYKFCHNNQLRSMADDNKRESLGDELGLIYTILPDELSLLPDDSDCCICLSSYVEGVELNILPCKHHFHCECIGKWLRINATCPICKRCISGDGILT